MPRGRRPIPPGLREKLGKKSLQPRRLIAPSGGPGVPPSALTPAQHVIWWDLVARGPWLRQRDAYKLEFACRQIARARELAAMGEKRGTLQRDKDRRNKMERIAPWERARRAEEAAANKTLTELGFYPGSGLGYQPAPDTRSVFERMLDADCPGHHTGEPWPSDA